MLVEPHCHALRALRKSIQTLNASVWSGLAAMEVWNLANQDLSSTNDILAVTSRNFVLETFNRKLTDGSYHEDEWLLVIHLGNTLHIKAHTATEKVLFYHFVKVWVSSNDLQTDRNIDPPFPKSWLMVIIPLISSYQLPAPHFWGCNIWSWIYNYTLNKSLQLYKVQYTKVYNHTLYKILQ